MRQKRDRSKNENVLQSAIIASLIAYCRDNGIRVSHLEYYANQQGEGLNLVCADFLATLDDSSLLLAETKVQSEGKLISFDHDQFVDNLTFEGLGFPIVYVYNTLPTMPYFYKPQPFDYPVMTLKATNCSPPSQLAGEEPDIANHSSLLRWLRAIPRGGDNTTRFADIFGAIRSEALITNGVMMLIYGTSTVTYMEDTSAKSLELLINALTRESTGKYLNTSQKAKLREFLDEEADAFNRWSNLAGVYTSPSNGLGQDPEYDPDNEPDNDGNLNKRSKSGFDFKF
ncbi:hypothetical protein IB274_22440 [Pseudomonas sp. PDM18]|uniref:Uncharacterized protein n=1 Tax=Pseudomonas nitroreducens TaxID=46680 RepID=A0A5R8ZTL7_PSENT|nr:MULTISPECIES: hypothetical protein [Pseudomonas]MBD9679483.1 hypothetical protein [Pseudomonas sp. PDM18]TLP69613.1 hypothetical protein FEA48_29445 [Pseudomonas nitroreducens]